MTLALPKVYALTEQDIAVGSIEGHADLVAETQRGIEAMIQRPAMFVGRDDLELLIPLLCSDFGLISRYVKSLGLGTFMHVKRLGSTGLHALLRRRVRSTSDKDDDMPLTNFEQLPKDQAKQALQKFADEFYVWMENHLVVHRQIVDLSPASITDKVCLADDEAAREVKKLWDLRLPELGLTWDHVAWAGPYWIGGVTKDQTPKIKLCALNKPYQPPRLWFPDYKTGQTFLNKIETLSEKH